MTNLIASRSVYKEPVVGEGVTEILWSDRTPYTVVAVSKKGTQALVQADSYKRTDQRGFSESQDYEYTPDITAPLHMIRRMPDGRWRFVSYGSEFGEKGSQGVAARQEWLENSHKGRAIGSYALCGFREKYHDFTF